MAASGTKTLVSYSLVPQADSARCDSPSRFSVVQNDDSAYEQMALYALTIRESQVCSDSPEFQASEYSQFKYGSGRITKLYGSRLAERFMQLYGHDLYVDPSHFVLTSSAQKMAPTAAYALMQMVHRTLVEKYGVCLPVVGITRENCLEGDYGKLDLAQRISIMKKNVFFWETEEAERLVRGRTVLVVDDIRITGAHESRICDLIQESHAKAVFLYLAALDPQCVIREPSCSNLVEDYLNHHAVKSLADVLRLSWEDGYILSARTCKFVLMEKQSNGAMSLEEFVMQIPLNIAVSMLLYVQGDGYHEMPRFRDRAQLMEHLVHFRMNV
eukprot:ANDGO_02589.mRNA.1 hypothetical protein